MGLLWQKLLLQTGLPEQILLALTDFVGWILTSLTLTDFLEQTLLSHTGLLARTLKALKVLFGRTLLPQVCLLGVIEWFLHDVEYWSLRANLQKGTSFIWRPNPQSNISAIVKIDLLQAGFEPLQNLISITTE